MRVRLDARTRLASVAGIVLLAGAAARAEFVIARLNINALRTAGEATVTNTPADMGTATLVFDGDYGTFLRSNDINPAFVQVTFAQPQTVHMLRAMFSGGSDYRWSVESADTQADMDTQTGSWARLVNLKLAASGELSTVTLPVPRTATIFKLTALRAPGDNHVYINEWELHAETEITALAIRPTAATIRQGETFRFQCYGTEPGGREHEVSAQAVWSSSDPTVATAGPDGHCTALSAGITQIGAEVGTLAAPAAQLTVEGLLPPPANLVITPYPSSAHLQWDPVPDPAVAGYEIYRRAEGGTYPPTPLKRVLARTSFTDSGLIEDSALYYKVVAIAGSGLELSEHTPEQFVRIGPLPGVYSRHKNFEILMVVYTGGYTSTQLTQLINGLKLGLEFYWRTSVGRLNLDPTWLIIDTLPPGPDWYSSALQADLRSRGVQDHQYDLAFLAGNNLAGCFGGYLVFGSTCASLGTVCGVPYPGKDPAVNYTVAWTFTHEIHHALELMEDITPGTPEVLFCHFPWCYPDPLNENWVMDWGAHYDGIALTNRLYGDQWMLFPPPYDGYIECLDSDGDGLPDSDARVWMDEVRFGSNPALADTDGDGLNDLREYSAYNFRGTDPHNPDTDGDGRPDGTDHQPLYDIETYIPRLASPPVIDGNLEPAWPRLAEGYYFTQSATSFTLRTYAGWDENALYIAVEASRPLRFMLSIDGSGADGRFASPVRHTAGAMDTNNPDNKHNHFGDSWGDGNHIYFSTGSSTAQVWGRGVIPGAQVATAVVHGLYRTEARIPRALPAGAAYTWYPAGPATPVVDGLTLAPGHLIGLNLTVSDYAGSSGDEFSGVWTCLFETHAYVDFTLVAGLAGDLDCDGSVTFADIDPFVVALASQTAYEAAFPDCRWLNADCNGDGAVDFDDIDPFVIILTGG